jgi:hypothetical protein
MEVYQSLATKLPSEIIINHIMPYTYKTQPNRVLRDIRSFHEDWNVIDSYYSFDFNGAVLLKDLVFYVGFSYIEKILEKLYRYKDTSYEELYEIITSLFYNNRKINIERKARMIWGLLLPRQRARFINYFILEDEE